MGYGISVINPSGELTISSNAKMPYCVGRCTLQETFQPAGTSGASEPGRVSGYSRYRIGWSGPLIFAINLPTGWYASITNVVQVTSEVWDVYVSSGFSVAGDGFLNQEPLEVYAYGFPPYVLSSYGVALYDKNGALSCDLSRPGLLFPRGFVNASNINQNYGIPSFGPRTLILGAPNVYRWNARAADKFGFDWYYVTGMESMWYRSADATLQVRLVNATSYLGYQDTGGNSFDGQNIAFVLDGTNL